MRDHTDNVVIVCSIENLDPMGVHTGDSVCVAPQQTLTDKQYQALRDQAIAVIRAVGVETGGSNVQFAVNRATDEIVVIEMNPRVSRSSALATKATGFPIAKIAARLAVGYTLQEIPNDITRATPASFEPAIDYCVVKWPRFAFEKFPGAEADLTTHMKSVGEAMALGRTFQQAFAKALRSRELDTRITYPGDDEALLTLLEMPGAERFDHLLEALRRGASVDELHRRTAIDPWFLHELAELVADPEAPFAGRADLQGGRHLRRRVRRPDPVLLLGLGAAGRRTARGPSHEVDRGDRPSVVILGSGPNRIGQGIEFDYCCVHAAQTVREHGPRRGDGQLQPGDGLDRLRHVGPAVLRAADAGGRAGGLRARAARRRRRPVRRPDAAEARRRPGRRRRHDPRHQHRRDRPRRGPLAVRGAAGPARLQRPAVRHRDAAPKQALAAAPERRLPAAGAPQLRARRPRDGDRLRRRRPAGLPAPGRGRGRRAPSTSTASWRTRSRSTSTPCATARRLDRRDHAARRGGRDPLRRLGLRAAAAHAGRGDARPDPRADDRDRPGARRRRAAQRPVRDPRRRPAVRDRGQPARVAHGAVRLQGDRPAAGQARLPDPARRADRRSRTCRADAACGHVCVKEAVLPVQPLRRRRLAARARRCAPPAR